MRRGLSVCVYDVIPSTSVCFLNHSAKRRRYNTRAAAAKGDVDEADNLLENLDLLSESVTVRNPSDDEELDLTGWVLTSTEGMQKFNFPEGFKLAPGAKVTIWSGPDADKMHNPPRHLRFSRAYVWNNKGDAALLTNTEGVVVARLDGSQARPGRTDAGRLGGRRRVRSITGGSGSGCVVM